MWPVRRSGVVAGVVFCIALTSAHANDRANVRGTGMAQASVAVARGLDAVGVNPANLALPDGGILTFTILPAGISFSSDLFTYDLYSTYLKNRRSFADLSDSDKQSVLNAYTNTTSNTRADISARLFGASVRIDERNAIAFAIDYRLLAGANIPKEYFRLLMYGNVRNSIFNVTNTAAQIFWGRTYSISYGTKISDPPMLTWLSAGVCLKLVQGYGYYETENLSASLQTGYTELLSGKISWRSRAAGRDRFSSSANDLFQTPLGYGVGVDIGVSGGLGDFFTFGISATDIGGVRWNNEVEKYSFDQFVFDLNPQTFNSVKTLERKFRDMRVTGGDFASSLPGLLRAGFSIDVNKALSEDVSPGELLFAVEYAQGVGSDTPLRERRRFSFGTEFRPLTWLPLRTGIGIHQSAKATVAFGFGLNFRGFDLDVGTENILFLLNPGATSFGSIGLALHFRIPTDYAAL